LLSNMSSGYPFKYAYVNILFVVIIYTVSMTGATTLVSRES
jgi:hypothetical protein